MTKHIYILGQDAFNEEELRTLTTQPRYEACKFHSLYSYDELKQGEGASFDALLEKGRERLAQSKEPIDGITTFWDFPAQPLVPLLCREYDLPAPDITAIERCEQKYWSRTLQQSILPEQTPAFDAIDPFASVENLPAFDPPYWLKPINSYSSFLAFKIEQAEALENALGIIREQIESISQPYNELLRHVQLPEEMAHIGSHFCIREAELSGGLCTVEGFAYNGEITVYGIIDSVKEANCPSFARYQYPSALPAEMQQRICDLSTRLMTQLPYRYGPFNIEYFYNEATQSIYILEINPRISQSHCELFRQVDGQSNQAVTIDLALGQKPDMPYREGKHKVAGKFFLRAHQDAKVTSVPSEDDFQAIHEQYPEVRIKMSVKPGDRLSSLSLQDHYSYQLAQLFIGAESETALHEIYADILQQLPIELAGSEEDIEAQANRQHQPYLRRQAGN